MKSTSNNISSESNTTLPRLLDQKELAEYLGYSTAWCERARWAGNGPKFIRLGRYIRYRESDVMEWLERNSPQSSTSEV